MYIISTALLVTQTAMNPAMQETWVLPLGWEDLLEKEIATHSSILASKIPWAEEPGRLQSMGSQRVSMTEQLSFSYHFKSCKTLILSVSRWINTSEASFFFICMLYDV